mgnify:CR=1 FL=1
MNKRPSVVQGYEMFRYHMSEHRESFIIVGGTAVQMVRGQYRLDKKLGKSGSLARNRTTLDIDVLVVVETLTQKFIDAFYGMLKAGNYRCYVKADRDYYYRFERNHSGPFPYKIELLTRNPLPEVEGFRFAKLPEEFESSLSAIVLDPVYYDFARTHAQTLDGLSCLNEIGLIVLKASACMNLRETYAKTQNPNDRSDYEKHAKDVFWLIGELSSAEVEPLPEVIRRRLSEFAAVYDADNPDWPSITDALNVPFAARMAYIERLQAKFALESR